MSDQGSGTGGPAEGGVPYPSAPPAYASASGGGVTPTSSSATALASDPSYPVTAGFDAPMEVARWRVIGNYILAIPHLILLYVLGILAELVAIVGWFAILFTGALPPGIGA